MKPLVSRTNRNRTTLAGWLAAATLAVFPSLGSAADAGLMQWSFDYHNTSVPVAIWYPTSGTTAPIEAGPFTLQAASGPMESRQHTLVVISHGTGGSNIAHHPIAESLAAAGFMVAALEHPGDNYQDRSLITSEHYFDERPRQVQALVRAITTDKELAARIDAGRIGAIGHSAGGYAVAVTLGARADRQRLVDHCQRVSDDPSCKYKDPAIGVSQATDKPFALPPVDDTVQDQPAPSIHSAVLLAPLGTVVSAKSRIGDNTPLLIISAEHDNILPAQYHLARLQQVAPHAVSRVVEGAGHFSFIAPVNESFRALLGEVAIDPGGFDRTAFNKTLGKSLVEWFTNTLKP